MFGLVGLSLAFQPSLGSIAFQPRSRCDSIGATESSRVAELAIENAALRHIQGLLTTTGRRKL